MTFTDDTVFRCESREQMRWRYVLERRGMKVTRSETEYMSVNERKKETAR